MPGFVSSNEEDPMPRVSRGPRYYQSKGAWFANINSERPILLIKGPKKDTRAEAEKRYRELLQVKSVETAGDRARCQDVLNRYLAHAKSRTVPPPLAPNSYIVHENAVPGFCEVHGER